MSLTRDLIYSFINKLGDDIARYGPPAPYQKMIEGGSDDDLHLHDLLNRVEDDRAHAEAEKIRKEAVETVADCRDEAQRDRVMRATGAMHYVADMIDPYEERDGQLVRKSDGQPVTL